jgi:type IV secretory pathway TrbL component
MTTPCNLLDFFEIPIRLSIFMGVLWLYLYNHYMDNSGIMGND